MGRHRLPSAPTSPAGRRGPRHAAHRSPARLGAPATMAAALLVAAPGGVALADDPPPAPVDRAGTLLGGVLGTDTPAGAPESSDPEAADVPARITGADIVGGAEESAAAESAAAPESGAEESGAEESGAEEPATEAEESEAGESEVEESGAGGTAAGETAAADVAATGSGATEVTLLEKNGSGVTGNATIDARRVVATASGLDPAAEYVSFFYGATSSATNNNPCILDGTNPLPSGQTVGRWEVDEDGNGTLAAPNPLGGRYALQAGTMSIRKVEHDFSTATALPVNPLSYSLVACGEVERLEVLDPVTDLVPPLPKLPSVPPLS